MSKRALWIGCLSVAWALIGQANAADPIPLRVMSFNVRLATAPDGENHWDKRKDLMVETIRRFDPDLLGTQETLAVQADFLGANSESPSPIGRRRSDVRPVSVGVGPEPHGIPLPAAQAGARDGRQSAVR
jgi:hypothetical protein